MIRASELSTPSKPVPYYRRRIAELVAEGKAVLRKPGRELSQQALRERLAVRLSWAFNARIEEMQDALVYYSKAGESIAMRRTYPKPALNGKTYVPKLPADAVFVGRYQHPTVARHFVRDLIEVIGGKT